LLDALRLPLASTAFGMAGRTGLEFLPFPVSRHILCLDADCSEISRRKRNEVAGGRVSQIVNPDGVRKTTRDCGFG
jgi:hypothetical protein